MLPSTFHFTQSSLQDYVDCPRRFQLRYIESQAWPGVEAEPFLDHENFLERGSRFHRLVERHQLGLDAALIEQNITDPDVLDWWHAYLGFDLVHQLEGERYPEFTLVGELDGHRLAATYDLLVVAPDGRLVIFDWKTYRRTPSRSQLADRVQTRLYRYLAVSAGLSLFGHEVRPEAVSMVYWIVSDPASPLVFDYSGVDFAEDRAVLSGLFVSFGLHQGEWSKVSDEAFCRFCTFRSLCARGFAGSAESFSKEVDNIAGLEFDFGLGGVEEIGF